MKERRTRRVDVFRSRQMMTQNETRLRALRKANANTIRSPHGRIRVTNIVGAYSLMRANFRLLIVRTVGGERL